MGNKPPLNAVLLGLVCGVAFLAAVYVYLFGFGNQTLSSESTFWAMPMACPLAFVLYLKWKSFGTAVQLSLYSLATIGAYQIIEDDCRLGNCVTRNAAAMFVAGMFAGVHMIAMFVALLLMCIGVAKMIRSHSLS